MNVVFWVFGIALVVFAYLFVQYRAHDKVPVTVARVDYETLSEEKATNGKVEPVVEYAARVPNPGVIQKIFVQLGQQVAAGTLLVQMNDADAQSRIASAQAALDSAQLFQRDVDAGGSFDELNRFQSELTAAKLDDSRARTTLETDKALLAKGSVSAGEVAAAQQSLVSADATLKSATERATQRYNAQDRTGATARVVDAKSALAAAHAGEHNYSIRTPIAGTVYSIPFVQYDFVPGGDDILDVADLNRLQIRAYFDEPEIGKLAVGQPVRIVWEAKPGRQWHGHILRVPTTIMTSGTRNVGECIITIDDAHGDLIPNTNVTVTVTEAKRSNVLSVPREALHTEGSRDFVYRIVDGRLKSTPVMTGLVTLNSAQIVSGLATSDVVVLRPQSNDVELKDGLAVKPIE